MEIVTVKRKPRPRATMASSLATAPLTRKRSPKTKEIPWVRRKARLFDFMSMS